MPRVVKPETAARKIVETVASGEFANADKAIAVHPEWAAGKALLLQATRGVAADSGEPSAPTARPRGSGPMRLSR